MGTFHGRFSVSFVHTFRTLVVCFDRRTRLQKHSAAAGRVSARIPIPSRTCTRSEGGSPNERVGESCAL